MENLKLTMSNSLRMLPKLLALLIIYQMPSGILYSFTILGNQKISFLIAVVILASAGYITFFFFQYAKRLNFADLNIKVFWTHKWIIIVGISTSIIWFQYILNAIYNYLHIDQSVSANQQLLNSMAAKSPEFLTVLLFAVFAPVCEEIIFRACFFELLLSQYPRIALIVSATVFATMHMVMDLSDWANWIVYLSMGLLLSSIYYKTRSLESTIAVHILWNLYAIFI